MNRTLIWILVSMLGAACLLPGCTSEASAPDIEAGEVDEPAGEIVERREIELTEQTRAVASDLTGFYDSYTLDMARYIDSHPELKGDGNVVVSPLSMAMLLSMVANGVDTERLPAFTGYLGTPDIAGLNTLCTMLIRALPTADQAATLRLANSIWVNSLTGFLLPDAYASLLTGIYDAEVRYEDFENRMTLGLINGWCSENTNGLIPDFLRQNPTGTALLLNALYFKDIWRGEIFSKEKTRPGVFHGSRGDSETAMMESSAFSALHSIRNGFEYLTLPMGNNAFRLEIILPVDGAENAMLTEETLHLLYQEAQARHIVAMIPKFKVESRYNVSDMLMATGQDAIMDAGIVMADGISHGGIRYEQATCFMVDEKGVEVSAISSGDNIMFGPNDSYLEVTVDRPFWFFIREFSTGACILSGRIANL